MAFPTIPLVADGRVLFQLATNPAGTHTSPNLSSLTKNSGDLLIAIVILYDGNSTNAEFSSWGGSFTEFQDRAGTATMAIGCAYKFSNGSETGTFTVTSADTSANDSCFILLSIPGAHASSAPEGSGIATGTTAAADLGSFSPSWGAEDTLWIAVGGSGEDATGGSFTGLATAPTNFSNYADSGISADVVGGVEGAVAFRQQNAASQDLGTWGVDVSNARNSSLLIAVRPPLAAIDLTPSPVAAVLAVPAPTIDLALTLSPAPVPAVTAVPAPTFQPVTTLSPAPVTTTLAVTTPTVVLSLTLTPAPVPAVTAVPDSQIVADQTLTPAPVAAVTAVPTPTVALSLALTPAPVATVLGVPVPTLAMALSLLPAPVAAVLAVPAPVMDLGALTLSPAPVPVLTAVPSPTLAQALALAPSPVSAVLVVPEPTVNVAGGPTFLTPDPVAAVLLVPSSDVVLGGILYALPLTATMVDALERTGIITVIGELTADIEELP